MVFKKQEKRTIIVGCLVFFLMRLITRELDYSNSIAALIASMAVAVMNFGSRFSWNKMMMVIPAIIIMILEFVLTSPYPQGDFYGAIIFGLLLIWLFKLISFAQMESYHEKCYPGQPNLKRMKKSFYFGSGIILAVMLLFFFF